MRRVEKREWHYTPKHGSWLSRAETVMGVVARRCLGRRIPDSEALRREVACWEERRNAAGVKVNGQFTTADTRVKLKRPYRSLEQVESSVAEH